ncbi:MAG: hypothetical protein D8M57_14265 [Candidatus Scalindua sp. AMX11]|nr:hypothetical protein [Planctomycetota bacterium]RZV70949.1 MAG: hypothetical protein EX341_15210 [Candidatus Scalindua sp. SCAELEC01]TDE64257.1 MAG: hypothetical protein D8M57_14265 [Candidatus Scalindua sp. AMX11]GJQ59950.1 MAG: hypothetical protein SCALA701_27510 [Candidatus Scalindua sp.]
MDWAVLTTPEGFTNYGTIYLETISNDSADRGTPSQLERDFTFEATYSVTVPAGGRVVLMHFLSRHLDSVTAESMARKLQRLQGRALEGMSEDLKADIVNFIPVIDTDAIHLNDSVE